MTTNLLTLEMNVLVRSRGKMWRRLGAEDTVSTEASAEVPASFIEVTWNLSVDRLTFLIIVIICVCIRVCVWVGQILRCCVGSYRQLSTKQNTYQNDFFSEQH